MKRAALASLVFAACHDGTATKLAHDGDEPASCAAGEVLDGESCVPAACGVGMWGSLAVDDATVYVSEGGTGAGSEANPLGSIQAGVDLAGSQGGGLVAVAAGTYVETVAMGDDHRDVTLAGRCRELVILDGSEGDDVPGVEIIGDEETPEIAVEGVTISGAFVGLRVEQAVVSVVAVSILENVGAGVYASDAATSVDLVDTEIADTVPVDDGGNGDGIWVQAGATLTATGCTVRGNTEVGVIARDEGTTVEFRDSEILDTAPSPNGNGGLGIDVEYAATLTCDGCTLRGNTTAGALAQDAGSTLLLLDTDVLDTAPDAGGTGDGIVVMRGAALAATGYTIQGNTQDGVGIGGRGTTADLVDTQVLDTARNPSSGGGQGVSVQEGAAVTITRCTIQGNSHRGVLATDDGTTVELVDTAVLDTSPKADGGFGHGVTVQNGAALTATGCIVQGNTEVGVFAGQAGTTVELVDTAVVDTITGRVTGFAVGALAQEGALIQASGSEFSGTAGPGVYVAAAARMALHEVTLNDNGFAAAMVAGGTMELTASTISGTLPDGEWGGGLGIYATDDAGPSTLTLIDSTIGSHPYTSVWIDGQGSYDLQRNSLSGSEGIEADGWLIHGNALFAERGVTAWDGASGLRLVGNAFDGAAEVAILLDGASATLEGNTWSDNGIDVWQQRCEGIVALSEGEPDWDSDWTVCPAGNLLTAYDLVFTSLYLPEIEPQE